MSVDTLPLTRHRLGCFCTHHSLGGGGVGSDPPLLSRKRMDIERRTRRYSKDLDKTLPNLFRKFKIEVTCQVKVRSKVKIGCFQVADRSDLKRSIFRPKLSICTPKQDYFTIKVCSVGKSDRRRDVTQGNPLRPSEWGFKVGYFPKIYGDFCTFSCFSLDTEGQIFRWSNSYRCTIYTYGARPL